MRVRLLGPLEVETDGGLVPIPAAKERAVVALLALRMGAPVRIEELIAALWGERPPPSARKAVQTYVANLRRRLPSGAITTVASGYSLAGADVDVVHFERLLREGRRLREGGDGAEAASALADALALWRDAPFPDLSEQALGRVEAVRLAELRCSAEEDLAELWLARGEHASVVPALEAAVGAEPLRERRWTQLMTALYRAGRQSDALRAYQRVRVLLAEELGVTPGRDLVELEAAVLSHSTDLAWSPPPPTPAPGRRPTAVPPLPLPANLLVGRAQECADLDALLRRCRLVTVTGPGGCGKTRLALEVARRAHERFTDGVVLVNLAPAGPDDELEALVATATGIDPEPNQSVGRTLLAALARRQTLLVLDNCEHVVEGAARVAEALVASCPQVRVLATSREALRCPSENRFRLPPLALQAATEMFAARCSASGYLVDEAEDGGAITEICRRLDGFPLAVEIAAARCPSLSPDEVLAELDDHGLSLAGLRAAERRHESLRTTIEWSYHLLPEQEQRAFRRLSVFASSAGFRQAQQLAGLADVGALIEKSLLVRVGGASGGTRASAASGWRGPGRKRPRVAMHQTIRQFAAVELAAHGERPAAACDHALVYLDLVEATAPLVRGTEQTEALAVLGEEHDNVAAAVLWGLESGRPDVAARLGRALWWYWFRTGRAVEGRRWIEEALAGGADDPDGVTRAAAGYLAWVTDDFHVASAHVERVLADPGTASAGRALALGVRARLLGDREQFPPARQAAAESEALYTELGDEWSVAWARRCRAAAQLLGGDPGGAADLTRLALHGFRSAGDEWATAGCLDLLGGIARRTGDHAAALDLAGRAVESHRRFEDWSGARMALFHLAEVAAEAGDATLARSAAEESLGLAEDHGYRLGAMHAHQLLAHLAELAGDAQGGAAHRGAAGILARELEGRVPAPAEEAAAD